MKILNTKEFLEKLNIGRLNIRDIRLSEPRLLPDELANKYNLVFNKITGRYDCKGNVKIEKDLVKDGRLITDFGVVKGNFICNYNDITSLEGCPTEVGGDFSCTGNNLTSLEGCPAEAYGGFYCFNNSLTSLEDCPKEVGGDFNCDNNELTSLEGCPAKVGGDFSCSHNNLTSLKGCPAEVDGNFDCSGNELVSLEGCPVNVNDNFTCWYQKNKHKFTEDEVMSLCNVKNTINV